ncbi:hypothetical protein AB205_0109090 [Aquarana catesbeiana]|uniref:Uncharacterized protein n=1 Tax=Aquarana catesbeiana TaxID=8400 RepID=A0A2G9SB22_AQUCT|nr:hypothetical protein AB205_0109090 [Aquarana catesbeiana]
MEKMLHVVSQMSTKMAENQCEDTAFLTVILGICKQVPPEKKYALRMALMSTAQSFVSEGPTTSSHICNPSFSNIPLNNNILTFQVHSMLHQ